MGKNKIYTLYHMHVTSQIFLNIYNWYWYFVFSKKKKKWAKYIGQYIKKKWV